MRSPRELLSATGDANPGNNEKTKDVTVNA
jgi:hypothetical protein